MKDNYTQEEEFIISQAMTDGTYLKAPNGEDTNLSPKQWVQVRTNAFKEWFGDWQKDPEDASKILDNNGEPEVIYHASSQWFTSFKSGPEHHSDAPDKSIFMSNDRELSNSYISWYGESDGSLPPMAHDVYLNENDPRHKQYSWGVYREGGIYPLFANMKHPLTVDFEGKLWIDAGDGRDINKIVKDAQLSGKYDGVIAKNIKDVGITDLDISELPVSNDYVAFNSNQVKSAIENIGNFSLDNADIRFRDNADENVVQENNGRRQRQGFRVETQKRLTVDESYQLERDKFRNADSRNDYATVLKRNESWRGAVNEFHMLAQQSRDTADSWKNREYKANKTVVTSTENTRYADEYAPKTTIEGANERRRLNNIASLENKAKEYEEFANTLCERIGAQYEFLYENNNIRFREVLDNNGSKSLIGTHNISVDKLERAFNLGGFANPSAAIVDLQKGSHMSHGEISLILPSSKLEREITYDRDAWTPIYPSVYYSFSNETMPVYEKLLSTLANKELENLLHGGLLTQYLDELREDNPLMLVFLKEKGLEPVIVQEKGKYSELYYEAVKRIFNEEPTIEAYNGLSEEKKRELMILRTGHLKEEEIQNGNYNEIIKERLASLNERFSKNPQYKKLYENRISENEWLLNGVDNEEYAKLEIENLVKDHNSSKEIDVNKTLDAAYHTIKNLELNAEYTKWESTKKNDLALNTTFFAGYKADGSGIYKPYNLEEVSKWMKKQGRNNSGGFGASTGLPRFLSVFANRMHTTQAINKRKEQLQTQDEVNKWFDKTNEVFVNLKLSVLNDRNSSNEYKPDFHSEELFAEGIITEFLANGKSVQDIKKELKISLSKNTIERMSELSGLLKDVPSTYFETKFERPVMLNEFMAAVIPIDTDEEIRNAISQAGLQIFTYKAGDEISREEAINMAADIEGVRFRFIGEKGAANLDRAEEATIRLDNLAIAREMEFVGKDALSIKIATGWERGADDKWRYEDSDLRVNDNVRFFKSENGYYSLMLSDLNGDDRLFDEYPELAGISVTVKDGVIEKAFLNDSIIEITGNFVSEGQLLPDKKNAFENILSHEIQHAIQDKEGFARGGSPEEFKDTKLEVLRDINYFTDGDFLKGSTITDTNSIREALEKKNPYLNSTIAEIYGDKLQKVAVKYGYSDLSQLIDSYESLPSALGQYHKLSGEVEARNVQSRMNMTPEERRNSLARLTEDIRREDQIFLKESFSGSIYSPKAEFVPAIESLANIIHVPIDVISDIDELPDSVVKRKIEIGHDIKGWFVPGTNNVSIYLPNISSLDDAYRTVLHEAVAHYGLRKMFGEHFDIFLDNVYNNATSEIQGKIMYATHGNPANRLVATEEYLAKLAEKGFHNQQEVSLWKKVKFAFIDMLHQTGVKLGFKLHDNDLRGILYKSYLNQVMEASSNNTKFLNMKTVNNETTLKAGTSALPCEIKDAPSTKIKLVVYKEHTLGYILPELPNSVQILHSSPLKGANGTTNLQDNYHINNLNEIRLASEKDFDDFNVDFKGYDDKEVYEYSEGVNTHKALKTNFLDDEFKAAVEGEDYKKLCQLKERGYVPTEEFIKSFSNNASINSLVTIQKIFGLNSMGNSLSEVEILQGGLCERKESTLSMSGNNNLSID